jgi:hypothetical protein
MITRCSSSTRIASVTSLNAQSSINCPPWEPRVRESWLKHFFINCRGRAPECMDRLVWLRTEEVRAKTYRPYGIPPFAHVVDCPIHFALEVIVRLFPYEWFYRQMWTFPHKPFTVMCSLLWMTRHVDDFRLYVNYIRSRKYASLCAISDLVLLHLDMSPLSSLHEA